MSLLLLEAGLPELRGHWRSRSKFQTSGKLLHFEYLLVDAKLESNVMLGHEP